MTTENAVQETEVRGTPDQTQENLLSNIDPFGPFGIVLWFSAIFFDLTRFLGLIPGVGNIIAIFISACSAIIMGTLVIMASGHLPMDIRLKKTAKKSSLRMLVGSVPFVGAVIPLWTLWMWKEMVRKK
jgi:hypothetical protein